jgi:3-phosphoglycerate kinase
LARPEWVLVNGQPVDFIGAFALMDNKLRAQLQTELAPCSTQVFMDAYAAAHRAKFGKEFGVMTSLSQ